MRNDLAEFWSEAKPWAFFATACFFAGVVAGGVSVYLDMRDGDDAVICELHDGTRVKTESFIRTQGAFASALGVCKVKS